MQVNIFGPTTIVVTDRAPTGAPVRSVVGGSAGGVKPRQILEILALSAGRPVSKGLLADRLWAGRPPRSHLGTLESYVCLLRRYLGTVPGAGRGVVTVHQGYLLDPSVLDVDLLRFRSLLQAAQGDRDPTRCQALLGEALALVTDDLLPEEPTARWAATERELVRQQLVQAEGLAATSALSMGDHERSARHARAALAHDPLAEASWRTLMRALSAGGRRAEALRAYAELRHTLAADLGIDPSPQTTDLYLELLRSEHVDAAGSREEVRMLVRLLHEAVLKLPDVGVSRGDPSWWQLAADVSAAYRRGPEVPSGASAS